MNIGKLSQAHRGSSAMARIVSGVTGRMDNAAFATFLFLCCAYLAMNFIFRWMTWAIFGSTGLFGFSLYEGQKETIYLAFMVSVPVLVWATILYLSAKVLPAIRNCVFLIVVLFMATVLIELDAAWFSLSRRHATWAEIEMFLTEDLQDHFGIQTSHILHYASIFAVHFVAFVGMLVFSIYFVRHNLFSYFKNIRFAAVAACLTLLVSVDVAGSVYMKFRNVEHWQHLIDRNLLSPGITPSILASLFGEHRDLEAANADLAAIAGTSSRLSLPGNQAFLDAAPRTPVAGGAKDILILAIEGFNPNFVNGETMPFFTSLNKKAITGRKHYSAANITLYGILGLIFGEPLNFYASAAGSADSPFMDFLGRHGYNSRVISTDLSNYKHMGNYMRNFTRPWVDREDWWDLKDPIAAELAEDGPNFVMSYYAGTHYPYKHDSKFNRFQPEVPKGFIYNSKNLQKYQEEIKNRYRNCLLEADAWLKDLFRKIDLENTVVVITGDHGEEFFENGRLSHASNLGEPQIRTPFMLLAPGVEPRAIDGITSHLNIMSAVLSAAGLGSEPPTAGTITNTLQFSRSTIVVHSNGNRLPDRWAVITDDRKSEVTRGADGKLRITALFDLADRKIEYRTNREVWQDNFGEIAAFQRFLDKSQEKVVFSLK